MQYIFGPVNSRRLGHSLGIDPFISKTCNYNCIYCEVGSAPAVSCARRNYSPVEDIFREISNLAKENFHGKKIDVCTISGSGEPTLHSELGKLIKFLKQKIERPVVVLTNGSLFYLNDVRRDLAEADIVVPSLDSANLESFRKINRPDPGVDLNKIIDGLAQFSKEFAGELWLEILLVKGINDSTEDIDSLRQAIEKINPDRIQLNSVARPPSESYALALDVGELENISRKLPGKVEIIGGAQKGKPEGSEDVDKDDILKLLQRRPCTAEDICSALHLSPSFAEKQLANLEIEGQLTISRHNGGVYFSSRR